MAGKAVRGQRRVAVVLAAWLFHWGMAPIFTPEARAAAALAQAVVVAAMVEAFNMAT
jgi:hypothetical protein